MNRTTMITIAGYNTFFWVCFWLFAYWTFPYDRVATYIIEQVDKGNYGYSMEIGSLSPYWFTGVELENVKLRKTNAAASEPDKDKKVKDDAFHIKEATARLGLFSLLLGDRALSFDAELEQGELEGVYEDAGDTKHLEASLSEIDLGQVSLPDAIMLPVKGEIEGDIDLTVGKEPTKGSGNVKLQIKGLTLGDGKAKVKLGAMGGLTIDPIEAGTVTIELDVKEGMGTVKKLTSDGKDLELSGSGEVRFADPIARSRIDLLLRLKFTQQYKAKSGRTKALFGLLDSGSVPQVQSAKTADGSLQFRVLGTFRSLRAMPAGRADASERPGARRRGADRPDDQEDEPN